MNVFFLIIVSDDNLIVVENTNDFNVNAASTAAGATVKSSVCSK